MYGGYIVNKHILNKPNDLRTWNISTHVSKRNNESSFSSYKNVHSNLIQLNNYSPEPRLIHQSQVAKTRNNSSNLFTKKPLSTYTKNKLKTLPLKHHLDQKYKVPNQISSSVAEIFISHYKDPIGIGLLVSEKLMLTSYIVIPSESFSARCIFRFINDNVYYRPRPEKFFYQSGQFSVSIIAVSRIRKEVAKKTPISFQSNDALNIGDILFSVESTCYRVQVASIEAETFGVSSHFTPLSGSPVFNLSWSLMGICHTTSLTYKYTECTSIESIYQVLSYIRSRYNFNISPLSLNRPEETPQNKEMKWFEFQGEYVEIYDIESSEWVYKRTNSEFLWHCCPVSVSENETILLGGLKKDLAVDEVYKYNSSKNVVYQLTNMSVARAFCAAVFYDNLVFAIGGKYANTFCEKYFIEENRWQFIPSMLHERYDLSAVELNHSIYVIGGEPRFYFGNLIEKFDILQEIWQEVPTRLPSPVACSPICVIDNYTCGVFGGRGSLLTFLLEVSRFQADDVSIKEGASLNEEIESIYPAVYSKVQRKVFILNTTEGFDRPVLYKIHSSYLPL